jgi:hypothetical protein
MSTAIDFSSLRRFRLLSVLRHGKPYHLDYSFAHFVGDDEVILGYHDEVLSDDYIEKMNLTFEAHPVCALIEAAPHRVESELVSLGVYPTESGLANVCRVLGVADALHHCGKINQANWILLGLYRGLQLLGTRNRVEYEESKHAADKTILYAEDDFSFYFMRYHSIDPAEWRNLRQQYRENLERVNPDADMDFHVIEDELKLKNKVAREYDSATMCYHKLSETTRDFGRVYYRFSYNGGLIARWNYTDTGENYDKYFSYSSHT